MMRYNSIGEVIEYDYGYPVWSTATIERSRSKPSYRKIKFGTRLLNRVGRTAKKVQRNNMKKYIEDLWG